jgi:DNA repair protein RecN (Recombination protein N)
MLAIKAQTAKYNHINTFLFDEIDAGISGAVAKTVSEKFARIAKDVQLIAITHLPQISAMADYNLLIEKSVENNKTITHVKCLNEEEKIAEVCRLTGGSAENVISKEHALSIINQANNYKKSI